MVDDNLDSIRERREALELDAWKRRWYRFFAATATVLTVAICALAWYTYSATERPDGSLPRLANVEKSLSGVNHDIQDQNAKLGAWALDRDALRQQIDRTGSDILHRAEAIKKQTGDAIDAMSRKIEARTDAKVAPLQSKVAELETSRETDRAQVASLQKELQQVRGDVSKQGDELAATRREINASGSSTERQLAALKDSNQRVQDASVRNRQDVDKINNNLATERVDFEVAKGRVQQLTPNISLSLTGVDIPFHRATGWLWVMPDRRTIWLRKQSVQEPVVFYGLNDGKKRELVITQVTKTTIIGYLTLPKGSSEGTAVAAVTAQ